MPSIVRLPNLFKSVACSEYSFEHEEFTKRVGVKAYTHVKPQNVDDVEFYQFSQFLQAIEINPADIDNLGNASYDNDVFKYHSPVYFGLRSGELGLLIGSSRNDDATDLFIKCHINEVEKQHGKKKIKTMEYTVNGTPIELFEPVDNEGKPTGKFYLSITHIDEFESETIFVFPFVLDKKQNFLPEDIRKAWKSGKFADICRDLDAVQSRLWIEANKAFVPSFESKQFPKGGVLLLVKNGNIRITPAGSYDNVKNDIVQSNWEIVSVSHPELVIQFKNKEKQFEFTCLGDATDIQFTSASYNNEGYTWLVRNHAYSEQLFLIHIVSPSAQKITNSPVNVLTAHEQRILNKIRSFPHMVEAFNQRAVKNLPSRETPKKSELEDINGYDNHGAKSIPGTDYPQNNSKKLVPSAPDDF